jgi:hypothetical protein
MVHDDTDTIGQCRVIAAMQYTYMKPLHDRADHYSFRQMYRLAQDVAAAEGLADRQRAAARKVVRLLGPVIDQSIAPAKLLAQARKRFRELYEMLAVSHETAEGADAC